MHAKHKYLQEKVLSCPFLKLTLTETRHQRDEEIAAFIFSVTASEHAHKVLCTRGEPVFPPQRTHFCFPERQGEKKESGNKVKLGEKTATFMSA